MVSLQKCHRSDLLEIITIRWLCVSHVGLGSRGIPELALPLGCLGFLFVACVQPYCSLSAPFTGSLRSRTIPGTEEMCFARVTVLWITSWELLPWVEVPVIDSLPVTTGKSQNL